MAEELTAGTITGSTIPNFISTTIEQIESGLPKRYKLSKDINFDLSVVHTMEGGGKVDLKVIGLGGNIGSEHTQKVSFSISPISDVMEAEERARIQVAREQENKAKIQADAVQDAIDRRESKRPEYSEVGHATPKFE